MQSLLTSTRLAALIIFIVVAALFYTKHAKIQQPIKVNTPSSASPHGNDNSSNPASNSLSKDQMSSPQSAQWRNVGTTSRFQVTGPGDSELVLDKKTGLMWTRRDYWNIEGSFAANWDDAMNWATKMNGAGYGGYHDWAVPAIAQYRTLYSSKTDRQEYRQVFEKTKGELFWSSNTPSKYVASYMSFTEGYAVSGAKTDPTYAKLLGRKEPSPMSVRLVRMAAP